MSLLMIGRACGVTDATVKKVLDPARCGGVSFAITRDVRAKVEHMLAMFGHEFEEGGLWKEHDQEEEVRCA